jgi:membrane-bound serine protease (ClpP class)
MNPRLKASIHLQARRAYLLLVAGVFAIIFEVLSREGCPRCTGGVLVLFGAYGLRLFPFNWAGLVFLFCRGGRHGSDLIVGGFGILSFSAPGRSLSGG